MQVQGVVSGIIFGGKSKAMEPLTLALSRMERESDL